MKWQWQADHGGQAGFRRGPRFVLAVLSILIAAAAQPGPLRADNGDLSVFEWGFIHLEYIRDERLGQLRRLCGQVHQKARSIAGDEVMRAMFEASGKYADLSGTTTPPPELAGSLAEIRKTVNAYYVEHFNIFQNVFFVNTRGDIIYSVRRFLDFRSNLFSGALSGTPLALALAENPKTETFVDFYQFAPEGKPEAFFIQPMIRNDTLQGWFVLQWSLNKINALFAGSEALGLSGETFLVNRAGFMLTESSFESDSTILKKHLDKSNVESKFKKRKGRKSVTDYRGATALSAFEVFAFMGTQWLVVAKVDEAQVLTDHFSQHRRYYHDFFAGQLESWQQKCKAAPIDAGERKVVRVDMDEFVRVNQGEILQTYGVSTCTALVALFPGKFGYLAHISPYDKVYGGTATSLVGHVLKKIKNYDIYKYERDQVRFVIVARHVESMPQIVDKLVEEGFYLSQITILHRPEAVSADVLCDYQHGRTVAVWHPPGTQPVVLQEACPSNNLSDILKTAY